MLSCWCSTVALHALNTAGRCEPTGRRWVLLTACFASVVIAKSGGHVHPQARGSRSGKLLVAFAANS